MGQHMMSYLDNLVEILNKIKETQAQTIDKAANAMFDRFQKGGSLFVFGASHAGIIAEEMFYRAGGLMIVNPIFNPTLMLNTRPVTITSAMEQLDGFGGIILDGSPVKDGDVLIMHSVSGRNDVTIDMAIKAREQGVKIIVITNLDYSKNVPSRHKSEKNLYEFGDIVIDNCGVYGDASIKVGKVSAGPTSTVTGTAIANMLAVGFAEMCEENGIYPPIFLSANLDEDRAESEKIWDSYKDRVHYM